MLTSHRRAAVVVSFIHTFHVYRFDTKDYILLTIWISILLIVLVVGIQYTIFHCQKLARTVRNNNENDDKTTSTSTTTTLQHVLHEDAVHSLKRKVATHSRTTKRQLGNELESMHQLQHHVATQLTELKSVLSLYATAMQQQQQQQQDDNDKQD